jgi:hypothetical protein
VRLKLHLIHVEPALQGIFCFGHQGIEDLSLEESRELMQAVQEFSEPYFNQETLGLINPWLWEINFKAKKISLKTFSLKNIINQELSGYMPSGKDSASWRLWMTEIQMVLHEHPINLARQTAGKKTINWIWLEKSSLWWRF